MSSCDLFVPISLFLFGPENDIFRIEMIGLPQPFVKPEHR